ncbi:MAG: group II truncated hemoglobin [Gemmatimonas sp.]
MPDDQPAGQPAEVRETTPYELIGGEAAVRRIVDRFYDIMDTAPEAVGLRKMHAPDLGPMRERLSQFLCGWLGGPPLYMQRPDRKCIMSAHAPFAIGESERDQWMLCMRRAMADCGVAEDLRALLDPALLRMCEAFRSR